MLPKLKTGGSQTRPYGNLKKRRATSRLNSSGQVPVARTNRLLAAA